MHLLSILLMLNHIEISISEQRLKAYSSASDICLSKAAINVAIASAKNGIGQQFGSECTPLGEHRIRAKIGKSMPTNTVFIGRRPTGEIYSPELDKQYPKRDWILTRILWLCGNELGYNRGGSVDTQRRFIYIHGAPDSHAMGTPSSHGCIKMRNSDIITLFEHIALGATVRIRA